jgi:hypothetical protein
MIKSPDQKDLFPKGKFFGPFSVRYLINSPHHLKLPWYRFTYYLSTRIDSKIDETTKMK